MKPKVILICVMVSMATLSSYCSMASSPDESRNSGKYSETMRIFQAIPEIGRHLRDSKNRDTFLSKTLKFQGNTRLAMSDIQNAYGRPVDSAEVEDFVGEHRKDGFQARFGYSAKYNVSDICLNHTMTYFEELLAGQFWALEMFDALGKPASGILQGHLLWPGSYDQCLEVEATIPVVDGSTRTLFRGEYCSVITVIPVGGFGNGSSLFPGSNAGPLLGIMLNIGVCLPNSCDTADATALVETGLSLLPVDLTGLPLIVSCVEEKDLSGDGRALIVLCVTAAICLLLLLGTAYDVLVFQTRKSQYENVQKTLANGSYTDNEPKIQKLFDDESLPLLGGRTKVETKEPQEPGIGGRLLIAFSLYTNASKILSTKQASGSLRCLNGIRFISMSWVILGHTFAFITANTLNVMTYVPEFLGRVTAQSIVNGSFSVDTFFLLSGLLVTYLTLKEMGKQEGKLNWFLYYFHRYWRLTPTMMLIMMVYVPLFKYWGAGPYWPKDGLEINYCSGTWWTNMLYVNNIVKSDQQCMAWTWYLANDMQFYIISPIILIPLYYSKIAGSATLLAFLLASVIAPGIISVGDSAGGGVFALMDPKIFDDLYIKPWCRMGPYLIGMAIGYVLYKTKCTVHMPKVLVLVGWLTATVCGLAVLYGMRDVNNGGTMSVEVSALYNAVSRTSWGLAVGWVIFACSTGYGGVINSILSWDLYVPLSRLTFCAYLVHPMVIYWYYFNQQVPMFITDINLIYDFLAHLVVSYVVAFVVSLAFEAPVMGLEKVILHRDRRS